MAPPNQTDSARPRHRRRRSLVLILLAVALVWLWSSCACRWVFPKRWGVVEEGAVYRSGQLSAMLVKRTLTRHHIQVIVDLTDHDADRLDHAVELRAARELGILDFNFPLSGDGTGDIRHYAEAIAAIVKAKNAGKPVLVHCVAGAMRTGGVIAAYRLLVERADPEAVRKEMMRYGWKPRKNRVLIDYLNAHMAELARLLVERGVIENVPDPLPQLPP